MRFKIYGENISNSQGALLYKTEESFNLLPKNNDAISLALKSVRNNDFFFSIDDKTYNLLKLHLLEIEVDKKTRFYSFFETDDDRDIIIGYLDEIQLDAEREDKIKRIFNVLKKFKPLLILINQRYSFIDASYFDKNTVVLMNSGKDDYNEKKVVEKNNFLIDALFLIFMPALTLAFLFITIDFFNKNNIGLGVLLIFISLLEVSIFGYSLILINREEKNKKFFSKYHIVLYLINIVGLLIGFGLVILLGNTLLKTGETTFIMQLAWISLGGAFAVSFILNIAMYYLNRWLVKRKNNKKSKVNI